MVKIYQYDIDGFHIRTNYRILSDFDNFIEN